jgi:hypothetical protein
MAIFRAYAKVLEPSDPSVRLYEAGLWGGCGGRQPGWTLAELLEGTGGVYETTTPLTPRLRADIREAAELTSDAGLLAVAELSEVPVSLEHLRGLDPQTRISVRAQLTYEGDEGLVVSRGRERRPGLATIMPDGTVFAGDMSPEDVRSWIQNADRG